MQAFEYCVPTRIVFGKDSVEKLPEQLKKSGASRVLVVYGGHSAKKSGLLDRVLALLGGAGVSYDTLGGVQPNPHLGLAREGVKKAIAMDAQLILAIGGGSVIDTAKAIAHGRANPDIDIWDFWLGKRRSKRPRPSASFSPSLPPAARRAIPPSSPTRPFCRSAGSIQIITARSLPSWTPRSPRRFPGGRSPAA